MSNFCCPVCGQALSYDEIGAFCPKRHRFDRARQGYFNLLQSQQSSGKRHGDDRLMVEARRIFLAGGYYAPLLGRLREIIPELLPKDCRIADIGCGEGYYTASILGGLTEQGYCPELSAIDISKDSAKYAARVLPANSVAVASAFSLPFADAGYDLLLNIFAPICAGEFSRVLRVGGYLVRVLPRERHLFGLKACIYDKPYLNPPVEQALEGFAPAARYDLDWEATIESPTAIEALFKMTPYYYKTSAENQARLQAVESLTTELSFAILVDQKI